MIIAHVRRRQSFLAELMDDHPNKTFLELCLAKQLLDTHTAAEADRRSRQQQRSIAATLLDMGALPQHTVDVLTREVEQAILW